MENLIENQSVESSVFCAYSMSIIRITGLSPLCLNPLQNSKSMNAGKQAGPNFSGTLLNVYFKYMLSARRVFAHPYLSIYR